jgi:hypothetical protein
VVFSYTTCSIMLAVIWCNTCGDTYRSNNRCIFRYYRAVALRREGSGLWAVATVLWINAQSLHPPSLFGRSIGAEGSVYTDVQRLVAHPPTRLQRNAASSGPTRDRTITSAIFPTIWPLPHNRFRKDSRSLDDNMKVGVARLSWVGNNELVTFDGHTDFTRWSVF